MTIDKPPFWYCLFWLSWLALYCAFWSTDLLPRLALLLLGLAGLLLVAHVALK